ncbi:MAG: hypothetical protein EXS06_00415 [Planctomycetaceae bacterium]|nr:hypothetical protein [Planctomycetaceae bacterium]
MTRVVWSRYSAVGLAALVCLLGTPVSAGLLTVANYNFSSQYIGSGVQFANIGSGGYTGWTSVGFYQTYKWLENGTNGGFTVPVSNPGAITPPAIAYQPGLSGPYYQYAAEESKGTIYQNLGVAFTPNTRYTVDISLGHRDGYNDSRATFGLVSSSTAITADGPATTLTTAGFLYADQMAVGAFDWASAVGSPNAGVFSFMTGETAPSGNIVVYVNSQGGRINLGGVTVSAVTTSAVPEIDPAGLGSVLALVTGALGLLERRRLKTA